MGLVDDHTAPGDLPQLGAVRQHHLEGGDQRVKLVRPRDQVLLRGVERENRAHEGERVLLCYCLPYVMGGVMNDRITAMKDSLSPFTV